MAGSPVRIVLILVSGVDVKDPTASSDARRFGAPDAPPTRASGHAIATAAISADRARIARERRGVALGAPHTTGRQTDTAAVCVA